MSEETLDLTGDMELAASWPASSPSQLRNHLINCFQSKIYTGRQCAEMFDMYNLWPSLDEIFENFVIGYLSRQTATEASTQAKAFAIPDLAERTLGRSTPQYMAEISAYHAGGER